MVEAIRALQRGPLEVRTLQEIYADAEAKASS